MLHSLFFILYINISKKFQKHAGNSDYNFVDIYSIKNTSGKKSIFKQAPVPWNKQGRTREKVESARTNGTGRDVADES